jgi:ankyrin repeat protein
MKTSCVTIWASTAIIICHAFVLRSSAQTAPSLLDTTRLQDELTTAVMDLDAAAARAAIQKGADPNHRFRGRGLSILAMVGAREFRVDRIMGLPTLETERRVIEVYETLFELGARLRSHDSSILHGPAIKGSPLVVSYLLERGANPDGADDRGNTPLILAIRYNHPDVVSVLLAGGAKPLDPATESQHLMIAAARRGDIPALRHELTRGANVSQQSSTGETALVEAVRQATLRSGNIATVRELLKLGANPNILGRFAGEMSPLHVAVMLPEWRFEQIDGEAYVAALLEAGAHVSSAESLRKKTPLHLAAQMQNTKAAALLLQAGAKVMPRDEDGKTPLDYAESSAMIALLKAYGAVEQ